MSTKLDHLEAEAHQNREAYESLQELLAGNSDALLEPARGVNQEAAATAVLQLGILVREELLARRFATLPDSEFDITHVQRLEAVARGVLHLLPLTRTATLGATRAKLPVDLVQQSLELRSALIRLLRYHLEDHPVHGPELADILLRTGYLDLASDLVRLANLLEQPDVQSRLSHDPHYQAEDATAARGLANRIQEELRVSADPTPAEPVTKLRRAWALLTEDYEETRAAAAFLFRHEPLLAARFPPLATLGRRAPAPKKAQGTPAEG